MKLRHLFTRRRFKWAGLVLCVLVLGVYVASAWYEAEWVRNTPNQDAYMNLDHGRLRFAVYDFEGSPLLHVLPLRNEPFRFRRASNPSIDLWPSWAMQRRVTLPGAAYATWSYVYLPLWIPLLLLSALTAYLWRADRLVRLGRCRLWMKFPRLIARRKAKWAGTICAVLVATVLAASYWLIATFWWAKADAVVNWGFGVSQGTVFVQRDVTPRPPSLKWVIRPGRYGERTRLLRALGVSEPPIVWLPSYTHSPHVLVRVELPLWMPLLLLTAPTAYLWYLDHRPKPWQCRKCRYDLRGLKAGICPECGRPAGGEV